VFQDIEFEVDMEARTGRIRVADVVEAIAEPIRNPVTGEPHRARVVLPKGFEYTEAEFASSTTRAEGAIALNWANCHAHFAVLHMTGQGVVR